MGKDLWKFLIASNPEWMFVAKSGILGKDAKKAEEELEEELPLALAVIVALIILGLAVYGMLSLFGIV